MFLIQDGTTAEQLRAGMGQNNPGETSPSETGQSDPGETSPSETGQSDPGETSTPGEYLRLG